MIIVQYLLSYLNEKSSTLRWFELYLGDGIINYENLIFSFLLLGTGVFFNFVQPSSTCSNRDSLDNLDKHGIVQCSAQDVSISQNQDIEDKR